MLKDRKLVKDREIRFKEDSYHHESFEQLIQEMGFSEATVAREAFRRGLELLMKEVEEGVEGDTGADSNNKNRRRFRESLETLAS